MNEALQGATDAGCQGSESLCSVWPEAEPEAELSVAADCLCSSAGTSMTQGRGVMLTSLFIVFVVEKKLTDTLHRSVCLDGEFH